MLALGTAAIADNSDCPLEAGPVRTVVRVIDGETFVLDDGGEVRLVGAMSPRASDIAAEQAFTPLEERAKRGLEALILGKSVALAFDGRSSDRYGRLLAQVFTRGRTESVWVQGHMVRHGLARAYGVAGSTACVGALLSQERAAREANIGLWSEAVYQVRSAERIGELLRFRSTYQIVEGRIVSTSERHGRIFLNFGQDWRRDFTASLDAPVAKLAAASGFNGDLVGRLVRVRGWIDRRGGPYIEVHHPHQVDLLPGGAQGSGGSEAKRPAVRPRSAANTPPAEE